MWSKLRFSIMTITTCSIGVLVTVGSSVNVGSAEWTTERGEDGAAADEPLVVDAVDVVHAPTPTSATLARKARRDLRVIGVAESIRRFQTDEPWRCGDSVKRPETAARRIRAAC
jgi:hypothetical protein